MSVRHFVFCVFAACLGSPAAFAGMAVVSGTPDGFEQLEAPRQSVVSLVYGGDLLGSFPVHLTPTTLKFDQPQKVLDAIPSVKNKAELLVELSQPLPVNSDQVCSAKRTENCGKLEPKTVGIIFNDSNLSGELFINSSYLAVVDGQARYLPLPDKHFSSVHVFNGAISGTTQAALNYTLSNDGIYSYGEKKLATQSTFSDQGLRFDTVAAGIERNGWSESAGLFRSRAMQLGGDLDMAGVSVATSSNTVLDARKTQGNDILLYLPRRSFVSIYREGRLYSSRNYDAGNQLIDTSELPDGAYTITLRIQEAGGATREEQRFFAKNEEIPPSDRPVYYAQGGLVRQPNFNDKTIPQVTSKPILRLGTVRRMTDNIGLGIGLTGVQDRAASEAGIYWLRSNTQIRATGLGSSKGDTGFNFNYLYTNQRMNASVDFRDVHASQLPDIEYQNLFSTYRQLSGTMAYAVKPEVTLGMRGTYSHQPASPTNYSIGPYAQWRIWQHGESMLELSADAAHVDTGNQGDVLMRFTKRFGNYGVTATGGGNIGQDGGATASARGWYQKNEPGNVILVGAGASHDSRNDTLNGDGDWRNNFGQLHGSVQQSMGRDGSNLSYGGNFAFNAAQLHSKLHVGGSENDNSAIIIHTKGDATGSMKIFVNGVQHSSVKIGDEQVIYLSPFHTYNIHLTPDKPGLYDFDSNSRKVTLYPGNVADLEWQVNTFYVVVGHIVTPDGKPLANALLQESRAQVTTGSAGQLQAELAQPHLLHFTTTDQQNCQVELPDTVFPVNGILLYRENLVCQLVTQNASP